VVSGPRHLSPYPIRIVAGAFALATLINTMAIVSLQ
jgi:hypothetical protein